LMAADFSWWNVVPTLVGGGISIATALLVFGLNQRSDRVKRDEERKKSDAMSAFVGLQKLMRTLESIENLARHIDRQFIEAIEVGDGNQEPASIVKPIIGASIIVEDLTAQESLFLAKSNGDLISHIWEIQQRARNNDFIVQEYNKSRLEFDEFMTARATKITISEGTRISVEAAKEDAPHFEMRFGRLNQIVVPLIEALEEDRITIPRIIDQYIQIARETFGDRFPAKKVEIRKRGS
jgi:hypothetical protein